MTQAGGLLTKYCKMLTGWWTGLFAGFPPSGDRVVWRISALDVGAVVVVSCISTFYYQPFVLRNRTGLVFTWTVDWVVVVVGAEVLDASCVRAALGLIIPADSSSRSSTDEIWFDTGWLTSMASMSLCGLSSGPVVTGMRMVVSSIRSGCSVQSSPESTDESALLLNRAESSRPGCLTDPADASTSSSNSSASNEDVDSSSRHDKLTGDTYLSFNQNVNNLIQI